MAKLKKKHKKAFVKPFGYEKKLEGRSQDKKLIAKVFVSKTHTARHTKLILFLKENAHPLRQALTGRTLNMRQLERSRKALAVRCNLTRYKDTKKF